MYIIKVNKGFIGKELMVNRYGQEVEGRVKRVSNVLQAVRCASLEEAKIVARECGYDPNEYADERNAAVIEHVGLTCIKKAA